MKTNISPLPVLREAAKHFGHSGAYGVNKGIEQAKADAREIVKRCNDYPAMLEALQRIEKAVGNYNPAFPMSDGYYANFVDAMCKVRAAIANATA